MSEDKFQRGLFLAIEGPDGAGKTSLITALADKIKKETGTAVRVFRDPGDTEIGEVIRKIVKSGEPKAEGLAQLLLFLAARCALFTQRILPALQQGETVLVDRWTLSTLIYQGLRNNRLGTVEQIVAAATRQAEDCLSAYLLIDAPDEVLWKRVVARRAGDKPVEVDVFEKDKADVLAVAAAYRLAKNFVSAPVLPLSSEHASPEELAAEVFEGLRTVLPQKR